MTSSAPKPIATALVSWFQRQGRDYPWRRTRDPYAILVSEVMLQQTQIPTVLERGFFTRWLERFPDLATLAAATEAEVLKAWEGLGYYRRARHLHKLAQTVMQQHGGVFPADPASIRALPGIGPYTTGAVASFAFSLPEPVVDGNVARVLSRLDNDATPIDSAPGLKRLWQRARDLVQAADDPRALNSALMELGQTICRAASPVCGGCPVRQHCRAKDPSSLPIKSNSIVLTEVTERVIFLRNEKGILLEQETGSRRTGLWKLPALPQRFADDLPPVLLKTRYGITRYKVTLWVHALPHPNIEWPENHQFIQDDQLSATAMPSPYRRALERLLQDAEFRLQP